MKHLLITILFTLSFNLTATEPKKTIEIKNNTKLELNEDSVLALMSLKMATSSINKKNSKNLTLESIEINEQSLRQGILGETSYSKDHKKLTIVFDFKNYSDEARNKIFTHEILHQAKKNDLIAQ